MDSITHIALGAVAGEALAGKYLGKRAMFYGALAQSVPDIDFIGAFFLDQASNLLFHRGFTHSALFAALATVIFSLVVLKVHASLKIPPQRIVLLFSTEILLHLVLDLCNAYGVGILEPFSDRRYSLHILFVADPFFSLPVGIAMIVLISADSKNPARRFWIGFGLLISSGYLMYAISNKLMIVRETKTLLASQGIRYNRLLTTPTPMNTWLWFVAAESDSGYFVTYRAIADKPDELLRIQFVPRNAQLLSPYVSRLDVKQLIKFSQDYYVVTKTADTVVFNDIRFGQVAGWADPEAQFVFHYYLNYPDANVMVIQRGRFLNWNRKTFSAFVRRIKSDD